MQLQGGIELNENLDKNGNVYYTDENNNIVNNEIGLNPFQKFGRKVKSELTNLDNWLDETNIHHPFYQEKISNALALATLPFTNPAVAGFIEGAGRGIINRQNPLQTGLQDAVLGYAMGIPLKIFGNSVGKALSNKLNPKRYWINKTNNEANKNLLDGLWQYGLDDTSKKNIYNYTKSDYLNINDKLRHSYRPNIQSIEDKINNISNSLDKYQLKEPTTFYRVEDTKLYKDYINNPSKLIGKTLDNNSFLSTSALKNDIYATPDASFIEINMPANKGLGAYIDDLSEYRGLEHEYLINKGVGKNIKIKNAFKDGDNLYIEAFYED